MADIQLI